MEFIANLTDAKSVKKLENEESLQRLESIFRKIGYNSDITFQQFGNIIESKNPFFVERMFKIFDKDGSNTVSKEEFMSAVRSIVGKPAEEKLKWLFDIYDIDGDGTITPEELRHVMMSCMIENGLIFTNKQIDGLTAILLSDADTDRTGTITFEKLKAQLARHPGLMENMSMSVERWILPQPLPAPVKKRRLWHKFQWSYIRNNSQSVLFLTLFIAINTLLFITRAFQYRPHGEYNTCHSEYMMFARANGQCLNFTCSFIIALMLRKCITYLRSVGYAQYLPLDHHVYYHKLSGWFICGFSLFHTVMHILNNEMTSTVSGTFISRNFDGMAYVTGWALLVILATIMIPAQPLVRSSGKFELFYYSHLFYIGFFVVLFFHAPNFWKWFIGPGLLFILEAIQRFRTSFFTDATGATYIEKGIILPSQVIQLVIKRPSNFDYNPGDYVFIRIPSIAKYEWHPFTISSAPEQEGELWLHIRAVGEWTKRLLEFFVYQEKLSIRTKGFINDGFIEGTDICDTNPFHRLRPFMPNKCCSNDVSIVHMDYRFDVKTESLTKPIHQTSHSDKIYRKISAPIFGSKTLAEELTCNRRASETILSVIQQNWTNFRRPSVLILPIPEGFKDPDNDQVNCEQSLTSSSSRNSSLISFPFKSIDIGNAIHLITPLKVCIDGPYGSPSSHIFRTQHAVMIATGIGVTPFASILQSIWQKHIKSKQKCLNCCHSWYNPIPSNVMNLKKVDFVWINRDQKMFEWFVELLAQLEAQQAELRRQGGSDDRFLDIHMYITSALEESDIKAIGLQLALDLMHEKSRRDLITGLKTRTKAGRPKWKEFFQSIADQRKGRVTVFFCGPSKLAKILHNECNGFGFQFCKEIF